MIGNISKTKCTGCQMCADACPKRAISYVCDEEGFWYPVVDKERCVQCGICIEKCPSMNVEKIQRRSEPVVYAAWSRDEDTRISSTSGGIFWEIGKYFIDNDGIVAGCRYGRDWKSAEHIIAYDYDSLLQIKGSKYFQSDAAGIYNAVKKEVESGKPVLFCGTPCQNTALSFFLGKEYSNLYYMDFICRSINSPLAFREYISELEQKYGAEAVKVHLKNKTKGWRSLASQVVFANGKESLLDKNEDWWVKGFIKYDLYTRESCYDCQYRGLPRTTVDITIGDFWGIKEQAEEDMFKGISVVLLNSEKGKKLFKQIEDKFTVQSHTIDEVLPGNRHMIRNPMRTERQDQFFELIKNHPFSYCVKECTGNLE